MASGSPNRMLAALSPAARDLLLERALHIELPFKTTLFEAEETPAYAFFITSGIASVVASMPAGETVQVGMIGPEGVVGGSHLLGPGMVSTSSFSLIRGSAFRIAFSDLRKAFQSSDEIRARILEFEQAQFLTAGQLLCCKCAHDAPERLASILLMTLDRMQSDVLELTQELLAIMLGNLRTTITLAAISLQEDGLIEYSRGRVTLLDRSRLETTACACYRICQGLLKNLYARSFAPA